MAARSKYCAPVAMTRITTETGASLPVPSGNCRQAISPQIANAVNYVLQGVLNFPGATGAGLGLNRVGGQDRHREQLLLRRVRRLHGHPGRLRVGLPSLSPAGDDGSGACYQQQGGGLACDSEMFGADAPGHTWQLSFERANLGSDVGFVPVPGDSPLMSMGDGQSSPQQGGGKEKAKGGARETVTATGMATGPPPTASSSSAPGVTGAARTEAPFRADAGPARRARFPRAGWGEPAAALRSPCPAR